eukprot:TRINITY_DN1563_c0_g1_i9.p3 TRINITY_DN1563_c0_g1~~TRINITY_DN1563_c0_g1_i9.p3  ORF type:complete len:105 (+),score=59.98 TRINITY_DN1563_c0_g1_i9:3-317(+)
MCIRVFFFSSRRRHTRCSGVSWARRCVQETVLRGNHEDRWINNGFGFSEECAARLGEDPDDEDSVFNRVNSLFDWLPLAAVIEDKIICLHGGIGSTLNLSLIHI